MPVLVALYRPKFALKLSYMLQAVEYDVSQYLRWFWLESGWDNLDSSRLKWTAKSRLMAVLAGLVYLCLLALAGWLWLAWLGDKSLPAFALAAGITALTPAMLAHLIILPLIIGTWLIQKPLELMLAGRTKRIFARHPGQVIVIAGSYGKTSMKHLLKAILGAKLRVAATPGNYNTPMGIGRFAGRLSGLEDVVIVEAGEYRPGDVARICRLVKPDIGFITGANEQHLTRMQSVDNALKTVFELAEYLAEGSPLYVNGESAYVDEKIIKSDLVYSRQGAGQLKISQLSTGLGGTELTLKPAKGKSYKLKTALMGLHQAGPLAAAAHLAEQLKLKPADIKRGLAELEAHERRFKPQTISGVTVIDDSYNGNPDGFLAGIDFLSELKNAKRRVYVTPGMVELGRVSGDIHYSIGRYLGQSKIDQVVLNRNPATEALYQGLTDAKFKGPVHWLDGAENFLEHLANYTGTGDVVLMQNSPREDFFYR